MQFLLIYARNRVLCSYIVVGVGGGGNIDASFVSQIFAVTLTATVSEMSKGLCEGGGGGEKCRRRGSEYKVDRMKQENNNLPADSGKDK